MRIPPKLLLFFLGLIVGAAAMAGEKTVSWNLPTTFADQTPLAPEQIVGTVVEHGSCEGTQFGVARGAVMALGAAKSIVVTGLPDGPSCFRARVLTRDAVSEPANPVSATVAPLSSYETTVFSSVKVRDGFALLPVGTAPVGTRCAVDFSVNGHYVVPRSAVTWSGSVRPEVVVAKCR